MRRFSRRGFSLCAIPTTLRSLSGAADAQSVASELPTPTTSTNTASSASSSSSLGNERETVSLTGKLRILQAMVSKPALLQEDQQQKKGMSDKGSTAASATDAFWAEVEVVVPIALGMKEVDTLLAIVGERIRHSKRRMKSHQEAGAFPTEALWLKLLKAARFADCEAASTTRYVAAKGNSDNLLRGIQHATEHARGDAVRPTWLQMFFPEVSRILPQRSTGSQVDARLRDAFRYTDGVVPLSMRTPCSDGSSVVDLLQLYAEVRLSPESSSAELNQEEAPAAKPFPLTIFDAALESLRVNAGTITLDQLVRLSFVLTSHGVAEKDAEKDHDTGSGHSPLAWLQRLFELFKVVDDTRRVAGQLPHSSNSGKSRNRNRSASDAYRGDGLGVALDFVGSCPVGSLPLELVKATMERIPESVTDDCVENRRRAALPDLYPKVDAVCEHLIGLLSTSSDSGVGGEASGYESTTLPKQATEEIVQCRWLVALARLKTALVECPDKFDELYENSTKQLLSEGAGGSGSSGADGDQPSTNSNSKSVTSISLRQKRMELVALAVERHLQAADRPRENLMRAVEIVKELISTIPKGNLPQPEALVLQRIHKRLLSRLLPAPSEGATALAEDVNLAYLLVLVHKYHGLDIDAEIVLMFGHILAPRGDCRLFNLIDTCTLFSNNRIDHRVIEMMFQACRVAGDHHRAKSLYYILHQDYPGFLTKLNPVVEEYLADFGIVEPKVSHFFAADIAGELQSKIGSEDGSQSSVSVGKPFVPGNHKRLRNIPKGSDSGAAASGEGGESTSS